MGEVECLYFLFLFLPLSIPPNGGFIFFSIWKLDPVEEGIEIEILTKLSLKQTTSYRSYETSLQTQQRSITS